MGRRKNKPTNKAICIYRNSREIGKVLKVFQNTLPNFERPKYFLSEFYLDENDNQIGQKTLSKGKRNNRYKSKVIRFIRL